MASTRTEPYSGSHFAVEIDGLPATGFLSVELPRSDTDEVEYREGNEPGEAHKLAAVTRYGRLVLRRGFTGRRDLYDWWSAGRDGAPARRNVGVLLLDEQQSVVFTWNLLRTFPVGYSVSVLDATSGDPVVETLEVAVERLEAV